jgi:hypothetical protein
LRACSRRRRYRKVLRQLWHQQLLLEVVVSTVALVGVTAEEVIACRLKMMQCLRNGQKTPIMLMSGQATSCDTSMYFFVVYRQLHRRSRPLSQSTPPGLCYMPDGSTTTSFPITTRPPRRKLGIEPIAEVCAFEVAASVFHLHRQRAHQRQQQ